MTEVKGGKEGRRLTLYTLYLFVLLDSYQRHVFLSKNDLYIKNFKIIKIDTSFIADRSGLENMFWT